VLGVTGKQRRDERNRVSTHDVYAQSDIEFAPAWSAALGVRSRRVTFKSADNCTVPSTAAGDPPSNPDGSGELSSRNTHPVPAGNRSAGTQQAAGYAGVAWAPTTRSMTAPPTYPAVMPSHGMNDPRGDVWP